MGRLGHGLTEPSQFEYLIERLPKKQGNGDNQAFLNSLGKDGWYLVDVLGRRVILVRPRK